jgi:serine/threonine protein kinase
MLYGRRPFAAKASQQRILQLDLISKEGKSLQFPLDNPQGYKVSDKAKKFITKCLAYHPENRITAK